MEVQDSGQDEGLAGEVNESLGMSPSNKEDSQEAQAPEKEAGEQDDLPEGVKARLGRQEKRHQREMRQLKAQIDALNAHHAANYSLPHQDAGNPYGNAQGVQDQNGGVEDHIQKAVNYALQHREMQERQAKEAESAQHLQREKGLLREHLNAMGDKYEDFHDKVFADESPFTPHMADYAVTLPRVGPGSAGEVLYKLANNREELERISKLQPVHQMSEMLKLSHALVAKGSEKHEQGQSRPLGNIKSNPVTNSHSITDKTPVSELRRLMKTGWKG